ncbi:hypothetical protein L218DRAFT_419167 [Marasmius fiardii PR-910]|nr:hypothetical protein L218DRAFT_419167 [Marasmius fiardii PR-910]
MSDVLANHPVSWRQAMNRKKFQSACNWYRKSNMMAESVGKKCQLQRYEHNSCKVRIYFCSLKVTTPKISPPLPCRRVLLIGDSYFLFISYLKISVPSTYSFLGCSRRIINISLSYRTTLGSTPPDLQTAICSACMESCVVAEYRSPISWNCQTC